MGTAWNAAIEKFQEMHPDVTVEFAQRGFEEIRQTAPMILNSDEAPDVMEYIFFILFQRTLTRGVTAGSIK